MNVGRALLLLVVLLCLSACRAIHLSLRFVDTLTWSFLLDTFKMLYMDCLIQSLIQI